MHLVQLLMMRETIYSYVYKVYESVLLSGWLLLLVDFPFAMTTPLSFVEFIEVSGVAVGFG